MPVEITFSDGNKIINKYSADGMKLETYNITSVTMVNSPLITTSIWVRPVTKKVTTGYGTQYAGNIEYLFNRETTEDLVNASMFGSSTIENFSITNKRIHNPEGYYANNQQYYYRKDHLGNNREVFYVSATLWGRYGLGGAEINTVQRTQYYPSGLPIESTAADNAGLQPYKAEGKEFMEVHGLDEYYSVFRNYYPAIVRTPTPDPHAESYPNISPYAWLGNNFVNRIDPLGMDWYILMEDGRVLLALGTDDDYDHLYANNRDDGFPSIKVYDKGLLPQLKWAKGDKSKDAITTNGKDAFNVFKFTADNSNVEWSLSGFKDNGQTKFYLNTDFSRSSAQTGESNNIFAAKDMLFNVHSHMEEWGSKGASGYIYKLVSEHPLKLQLEGYDKVGGSDGFPAKHLYEATGKVMPMYVYHVYTRGLYQFTPWDDASKSWLNITSGAALKSKIYP